MRTFPLALAASLTTVVTLGALGAACGSSKSGGGAPATGNGDASNADVSTQPSAEAGADEASLEASAEGSGYPALLPTDIPQVVSFGGKVMPLPKVVPILYAGDDPTMTASIQDFVKKLGATQYWSVTGEYGVGQVVGETAIQLTSADDPPLVYDDSDIENWLANKIQTQAPGFGTPDANTIYTFFFPPGITITQGGTSSGFPADGGTDEGGADDGGPYAGVDAAAPSGSVGCATFGGYHSAIQLNDGTLVAYAVVPRCANFDGFTGIDAVTAAASHEIGEASTDPYLDAYLRTDTAHSYWSTIMGGGEIGDLCAQNLGSFTKFSELPYVVQRLWSNKAALTGLDPCVPVPSGEVYFNTIPKMPDTLQVSGRGADGGTSTTPALGAQIAVGSSKTIELDLFSTAPTASAWNVKVYDAYDLQLATAQQLTFALNKSSGQNGDTLSLTITVKAAGRRNTEPFLIVSSLVKDGNTQNLWAGLVGQ